MPIINIDFTKNSPYGIIQEGFPKSFMGCVYLSVGLRTIRDKLACAFIVDDGYRFFRVVCFDNPEVIRDLASVNTVVKINSAIAKYCNSCPEIHLDVQVSEFELHTSSQEQLSFFGKLNDNEVERLPNYKLYIEDE